MIEAAELVPVEAVPEGLRAEMRALLERHFEGVRPDDFAADLAEKDHVVVLRGEGGRLAGFSTLKVYASAAAGAPRRVLFSGDTIVAPEAWRSTAAIRGWLRGVFQLRAAAPAPLDWFLLSSGHRTFRVMATLFHAHCPHPDGDDPALRRRLHAYAGERFGEAFDPARGVVTLRRSIHRLRPGLGEVTDGRLKDPVVALFAARNPGHARGDELACLCEISEANLTAAGRRFLEGR